jgi:hypothetical protein
MTLFNYALDNGLLFGVAFVGTVGFIGYKFATSYINSIYIDKEVQTAAWEDYSDRTSQITSNSITSIDTVTPISDNVSPTFTAHTTSEIGIQTITDGSSTTTVLPIPPINIEMIPNPDIVLNTVKQINTLDNFLATAWTPDKIQAMLTSLDLVSNFS